MGAALFLAWGVVISAANAETKTYSLLSNSSSSAAKSFTDGQQVELGTKFSTSQAGTVSSLRFLKANGESSVHVLTLWDSSGKKLTQATTKSETKSGWQEVALATPVQVAANSSYVVSYHVAIRYLASENFFTRTLTNGPLSATANAGVYRYGSEIAFPRDTYKGSNYWVDVVFNGGAVSTTSTTAKPTTTVPPTTVPPTTTPTTVKPPTTVPPTTVPPTTVPPTTVPPVQTLSAFPDATNTGITAPEKLKQVKGDYRVVNSNSTVENLDIEGCLILGPFQGSLSNVVIQNVRVSAQCAEGTIGPAYGASLKNITIQDVEVNGEDSTGYSGIAGENLRIIRANVHNAGTLIRGGSNVTVQDSYLHGGHAGGESHNSGFSLHGGSNVTLLHNTIRCEVGQNCTAAVEINDKDALMNEGANIVGVQIISNLLSSDTGACIYAGNDINVKAGAQASGVILDGNVFTDNHCGELGPVIHWYNDADANRLGNRVGNDKNRWTNNNHWLSSETNLVSLDIA
jgi:hypothetical protein